MQNFDAILWLILVIVVAAIAIAHSYENIRLTKQWQNDLSDSLQQFLTRFAWSRTLQTLVVLACYSIVIVFYNVKVSQLTRTASELTQQHAALAKSKQELEDKNNKLLESNTTLSAQITGLNQQLSQQTSTMQLIAQQQQALNETVKSAPAQVLMPPPAAEETEPEAEFNPDQQPTIAPINQSAIEQVYNPEANQETEQAKLDTIKKRYEDILVIHFFLKKCGRTTSSDYHIITSALSQEMASVNAPGRLQNDILTAAQGSYREMYALSDCNAEGVSKLNDQYIQFINAISQNYTAQ